MQGTPESLPQAASGSHLVAVNLVQIGGRARTCQRRRRYRRKPAAACGRRASRMHDIRNMQLASSPAVADRPAEAALCLEVTCEQPDARLPYEYAGFGENFLRTQQAHTNTRPTPASSWMGATCSRHEPRSHHIAGLTRSNARGRSDLHSPSDACTFQTCATAGMTQDSCRTQAASSHFRHNSQNSRRRGRWLGLALGYRQPWLLTCGIQSRHAVSAH